MIIKIGTLRKGWKAKWTVPESWISDTKDSEEYLRTQREEKKKHQRDEKQKKT